MKVGKTFYARNRREWHYFIQMTARNKRFGMVQ
jgi:hypothetical protein